MKYEAIKLLRQLVADELRRTHMGAGEMNGCSAQQQQDIKEAQQTALELKNEINNLEFKIFTP